MGPPGIPVSDAPVTFTNYVQLTYVLDFCPINSTFCCIYVNIIEIHKCRISYPKNIDYTQLKIEEYNMPTDQLPVFFQLNVRMSIKEATKPWVPGCVYTLHCELQRLPKIICAVCTEKLDARGIFKCHYLLLPSYY